ncbi:MAG: PQQ-binding-like beta-propeller repeat protein [Methanomicrobium sp.]|nr:PQQ-binding-like beta-propeller repeat protein [Methanomicrobium sp.]
MTQEIINNISEQAYIAEYSSMHSPKTVNNTLSLQWVSNLTNTDQSILEIRNNSGTSHFLNNLALSDDGKTIAAGTYDNSIYLLNQSGTILWNKTSLYESSYINSFSLSPEGDYLAISDTNSFPEFNPAKAMSLINSSGKKLWNNSAGTFVFYSKVSSDGSYSVFGSRDNITCFDKNGSSLWNFPVSSQVTSLDMAEDGRYTVALLGGKSAVCLDNGGKLLWEQEFNHANGIKISGDGNYICLFGDSVIKLCFMNNKGDIFWNRTLNDKIIITELSYKGDNIVVRTTDNVYSYDLYGDRRWQYTSKVMQPSLHTLSPPVMALSKDGLQTVLVEGSSLVILNNSGYNTGIYSFENTISGVCISSDGKEVAAITANDIYFLKNSIST